MSAVRGRSRRTQKAAISHTEAFWDHLTQVGVNSNRTGSKTPTCKPLRKCQDTGISRPSSSTNILHPKDPKSLISKAEPQ